MMSNEKEKENIPEETRQEYDFKNASSPVDEFANRVCMACKSCNCKVQSSNQRLDERAEEEADYAPSSYEFDR